MFSLRLLAILTAGAVSASTAPTDKAWTASCAAYATSSSALGDSCVGKACASKFIAQTKHPDLPLTSSSDGNSNNGSSGNTNHDTSSGGSDGGASAQPTEPPSRHITPTPTPTTATLITTKSPQGQHGNATAAAVDGETPNAGLHGQCLYGLSGPGTSRNTQLYCPTMIQPSTRPLPGSAAQLSIFTSSVLSRRRRHPCSGSGRGRSRRRRGQAGAAL